MPPRESDLPPPIHGPAEDGAHPYWNIEIEARTLGDGKVVIAGISFISQEESVERNPPVPTLAPTEDSGDDVSISSTDDVSVSSTDDVSISSTDSFEEMCRRKKANPLRVANQMNASAIDLTIDTIYDSLNPEGLFAPVESHPTKNSGSPTGTKPLKSAMKKTRCGPTQSSKTVGFDCLTIREHGMTLGNHPSAATGPPVTLEWKYNREETLNLDKYERGRRPRRSRKQLRISFKKRERVLTSQGFSTDEIKQAWLESQKVRRQRYETLLQGFFSTKMEEVWQSASRKFWRLVSFE